MPEIYLSIIRGRSRQNRAVAEGQNRIRGNQSPRREDASRTGTAKSTA